jgi:ribonuclease HI
MIPDVNCGNSGTYLFTDGSVHPGTGIGFGAYLQLSSNDVFSKPLEQLQKYLKIKRFSHTSSTKNEITTLLWALEEVGKCRIHEINNKITVFTDSQCITGLPARRMRLEKNGFRGAGKDKELTNSVLYREFYKRMDNLNLKVIKLKGHSKTMEKDRLHKVFAIVDKGSREALRTFFKLSVKK